MSTFMLAKCYHVGDREETMGLNRVQRVSLDPAGDASCRQLRFATQSCATPKAGVAPELYGCGRLPLPTISLA